MASSRSARFRYTGRFLSFVPGKKSPYQQLLLQVVHSDKAADVPIHDGDDIKVKLPKDLRRMMYGYLEPNDWVAVVGKLKVDADTGETTWKAREIAKLSPRQVKKLDLKGIQRPRPGATGTTGAKRAAKPVRVLICQKSDCRKKGSLKVQRAVEEVVAAAGDSTPPIKIQATGCMKRCKAGPNVVIMPSGEKHRRVTPKEVRSLVKAIL